MTGTLIEIRRYVALPGKRDELAAYMDGTVIPFVRERGVEVNASLVDIADADAYIWIRTFDDDEDRTRKYAAVYQDPQWVATIEPVVRGLMDFDRAVIMTVTPTGAGIAP